MPVPTDVKSFIVDLMGESFVESALSDSGRGG